MKVFFSHASTDKPLIREIAGHLLQPLEAWVDEEQIAAGEPLRERLEHAVGAGTSYVAVFLDKAAIASEWVSTEVRWALEKEAQIGRPLLIPVVLDSEALEHAQSIFGDRTYQKCLRRDLDEVRLAAEQLSRSVFSLMSAHLERLERAEMVRGVVTSARSLPIRTLGRRSALSPDHWRDIFRGATRRIWLLGHAMRSSVHPRYSGAVLRERLANRVDVRLVVLDPDDPANQQVQEITWEMKELNLRGKIDETLKYARDLPVRLAETMPSNLSLSTTQATIHNSIVMVDDRVIVTMYSHNNEMGDTGVTLDLHATTEAELCAFFETEFLWHWIHARSAYDPERTSPDSRWRILNHVERSHKSVEWFDGHGGPAPRQLPPPYLAVIFPTYRCRYGARNRAPSTSAVTLDGPHGNRLLCSNCMFGELLNGRTTDMAVDTFASICGDLIGSGVSRIELAGGGEPLHHDNVAALLSIAAGYRRREQTVFGLIANAASLAEAPVEPIVDAFSYVRWSWPEDAEFDPDSRATYIAALKRFVAECERLGRRRVAPVRVGMKILLTVRNVEDRGLAVMALVEDVMRAGVAHVKVRPLRGARANPTATQLKFVSDGLARLEARLWREGWLGEGKTIETDLAEEYVPTNYRCKLSTLVTVIEPTGDVRMCWNDVGRKPGRVLGNVSETPFSEIWGSQRHRQIVREMNPGEVCNSMHGCHCRVAGYQEVLDRIAPAEVAHINQISQRVPRDNFL